MSIRSSCSRSWDSVAPFITVWVTRATSAGARPSARALSWSRSTFRMRTGSFQSSWTSRTLGLDATTASTSRAISRTFCVSGPTTRNCTGKPTGGPSSRRVTRTHTCGNSLVDARHQARAHPFARLHVARHDDEDGVARVRQLRIEREIEARLAGARVGGEEPDILVLRQERLHPLDLLGRRGERSAFLQSSARQPVRAASCSGRTAAARTCCPQSRRPVRPRSRRSPTSAARGRGRSSGAACGRTACRTGRRRGDACRSPSAAC